MWVAGGEGKLRLSSSTDLIVPLPIVNFVPTYIPFHNLTRPRSRHFLDLSPSTQQSQRCSITHYFKSRRSFERVHIRIPLVLNTFTPTTCLPQPNDYDRP